MKTTIHIGDCLEVLRTLPAGSVQTCITSPPYWGLRNYLDADSQIGLEKTPEDHIAVMVEVFREVRRVLRDDGTLWMNYGDAYAGGKCGGGSPVDKRDPALGRKGHDSDKVRGRHEGTSRRSTLGPGLKPKDLIGMPWRVALALQADGWWLRSSIIWAKGVSFCDTYSGSVMPESCRDRPTRAHENIFLLSKAPRYFYDADAVRENETRNLRDVWIINPQGFPGAHFATFPPALVEPCIKAGTSEKGCCSICGAPIRRIVEATGGTIGEGWHDHSDDLGLGQQKDADGMESYSRETTGWESTCTCEDAGEPVPCKVLDPFGGAGTAALVADRLGRDAVLVELNKEYAEMARDRILADCPMFSSVQLVGGCKEKTPRNK
jgi:DNA modification methylase|tara:strand:- start:10291 stop:11424 length:1134 start_codon:yes stop_codon:yes gene_type:complete